MVKASSAKIRFILKSAGEKNSSEFGVRTSKQGQSKKVN